MSDPGQRSSTARVTFSGFDRRKESFRVSQGGRRSSEVDAKAVARAQADWLAEGLTPSDRAATQLMRFVESPEAPRVSTKRATPEP